MIAPTVTTIGKQQVDEALKKLAGMFEREELSVLVGVPSGAGSYPSENGRPALNIATVAAVNEFGTADGRIPARPFLRPAMEEGTPKFVRIAEIDLPDILLGKQPLTRMLHRMGNVAVGMVQQKITDVKTPPNAASTIAKKGSDNPLIDTGALRQSINYEVIDDYSSVEEGL